MALSGSAANNDDDNDRDNNDDDRFTDFRIHLFKCSVVQLILNKFAFWFWWKLITLGGPIHDDDDPKNTVGGVGGNVVKIFIKSSSVTRYHRHRLLHTILLQISNFEFRRETSRLLYVLLQELLSSFIFYYYYYYYYYQYVFSSFPTSEANNLLFNSFLTSFFMFNATRFAMRLILPTHIVWLHAEEFHQT